MVAVHWSPEACIADTQASEGGLSKIMSAATNVRNAPLRTTVVVYKYLWIRRQLSDACCTLCVLCFAFLRHRPVWSELVEKTICIRLVSYAMCQGRCLIERYLLSQRKLIRMLYNNQKVREYMNVFQLFWYRPTGLRIRVVLDTGVFLLFLLSHRILTINVYNLLL